jgi:hypothetical protein
MTLKARVTFTQVGLAALIFAMMVAQVRAMLASLIFAMMVAQARAMLA